MRLNSNTAKQRNGGGRPQEGLSLIELIGVLAVMAVVAVLVVPATLRHLDQVAGDLETARLKALGAALQGSILRTTAIPNGTNWVAVVAMQSGLSPSEVSLNGRRKPRVLLWDPSGWLSTNLTPLPYTQTHAGTPNFPANARMILLSSLGTSLPGGITNGPSPTAAAFEAVWNWPEGTNAPPEDAQWTGWPGAPDLVVQRINLSPLFVRLALTTYSSGTNGQYAVGSSAIQPVLPPGNNGIAAYFLKGTVLKLYTGAGAFDGTQVLEADASYVFEAGRWRDSVQGRVVTGVGDISGIVAAFLAATPNTNAQNAFTNYQQILVVSNMIIYLSNYNAWAVQDFPTGPGTLQKHLSDTVQPALMDAVNGLYGSVGGNDYYPTNGLP